MGDNNALYPAPTGKTQQDRQEWLCPMNPAFGVCGDGKAGVPGTYFRSRGNVITSGQTMESEEKAQRSWGPKPNLWGLFMSDKFRPPKEKKPLAWDGVLGRL